MKLKVQGTEVSEFLLSCPYLIVCTVAVSGGKTSKRTTPIIC